MTTEFDPRRSAFSVGVRRVDEATATKEERPASEITTSLDDDAEQLSERLSVTNVPTGFTKHQLPFYFDEPSQFYMTKAAPGATAPRHSHPGAGVRLVVSGSIIWNGKVLEAGDWMHVPADVEYEFRAGDNGATMFYCYQCCCV